MAVINFQISSPTEGSSWSGSITVANTTDIVGSTVPSSVEPSGLDAFTPTQSLNFGPYFTWREQNDASQFPSPQSGMSLDVWSDDLMVDIGSNSTWGDLVLNGAYNLNTDKWTLIYDYTGLYAPYVSKGGTITFTNA